MPVKPKLRYKIPEKVKRDLAKYHGLDPDKEEVLVNKKMIQWNEESAKRIREDKRKRQELEDKKLKILVTGGAGFIGTNLIKRLVKDGHSVTSADNYSTGLFDNQQEGCKYIWDSITATDPYKPRDWMLDECDIIYHLAAAARIAPSFNRPRIYLETNVVGTFNVLEYAKSVGAKVVYASSSSIHYGTHSNPYTLTKWQGEELCQLYRNDVPSAICRFYNVYGEHMILDGEYATILGIFQRQYLEGKPFTITGTGEQRRDFTYVGDIVDGLIRAANSDILDPFEFGRGKNYSINEVAEMFGSDIEYIPARQGEARETIQQSNLSAREIGWEAKMNLKDWIDGWIKKI